MTTKFHNNYFRTVKASTLTTIYNRSLGEAFIEIKGNHQAGIIEDVYTQCASKGKGTIISIAVKLHNGEMIYTKLKDDKMITIAWSL